MLEKTPTIEKVLGRLFDITEAENVAEILEDDELAVIGINAVEEFELDERSREEWERSARKAMDSALQVTEPKNYPFQNAANIKWPLLTTAALQFNARAYPEIVNGDKIVKGRVIGNDDGVPQIDPQTQQQAVQVSQDPQTGEEVQEPLWEVPPGAKQEQADNISEHMSYQLLEEIEEWEEDTDTLLMQIPIIGCAFRKIFFDKTIGRPRSEMVSAFNLVVNNDVSCLEEAPRISHKFKVYPNDVEERKRSGVYINVELGEAHDDQGDATAPHKFIEQHRLLDLDEDGLAEPYIVTVHLETRKVVSIVANFTEDDIETDDKQVLRIKTRDYFVKYPFIPDPDGGFYDKGFGHLLEGLGGAIDTAINQMLDAGHLQNAGGGFIGSGLRLKKGVIRQEPGKYSYVSASGDNIRNAIYNFDHPGPSSVLFTLLGLMLDAAKDITATKDILTGDTGGQTQTATTTLALIEQGLKVFTAIYKRIYRSFKKEFKILFRINSENLPEQAYFSVLDKPKAVARADYDASTMDVVPQADPKMVTDMQRLARAQILMDLRDDPFLDPLEIRRRFLTAGNFDDVEGLLVENQGPSPAEKMQADALQADTGLKKAQTMEILSGIEDADEEIKIKSGKESASIIQKERELDIKAEQVAQKGKQ